MTDAVILHGQDVTESTSTSTVWVDGGSIPAASFEASTEYIILAVESVHPAAGTTDSGTRLVHGATPTLFTDADGREDTGSTDERWTRGWLQRWTQPGTTEVVKTQHNLAAGSSPVTHMFSSILAFKTADLGSENTNWWWNEDTADHAGPETAVNHATVTFTPTSGHVYLIAVQGSWGPIANGDTPRIRVTGLSSGSSSASGRQSNDANETRNALEVFVRSAADIGTGSRTLSTTVWSGSSTTLRSSRIFVLDLTAVFADVQYSYNAASDTPGTSPTWATSRTLTFTPGTAGDYIILGAAGGTAILAADNLVARLQTDSSSDPAYGDDAPDNLSPATGSVGPRFHLLTKKNLSAASHTVNLDTMRASGSTAVFQERSIVAFSVRKAAGGTQYNQSCPATSTFTSAYLKQVGKPLAVSSTFASLEVKSVGLVRGVASAVAVALVKQPQVVKTNASTFVAGLSKGMLYSQVSAATSAFAAALSTRLTIARTLAASSTFTSAVSTRLALVRSFAASSTMASGLQRQISKTFPATSSMVSAVTKGVAKTFAATSTMSAAVAKGYFKTLGATSSFVSSALQNFIPGGGPGGSDVFAFIRRMGRRGSHSTESEKD